MFTFQYPIHVLCISFIILFLIFFLSILEALIIPQIWQIYIFAIWTFLSDKNDTHKSNNRLVLIDIKSKFVGGVFFLLLFTVCYELCRIYFFQITDGHFFLVCYVFADYTELKERSHDNLEKIPINYYLLF